MGGVDQRRHRPRLRRIRAVLLSAKLCSPLIFNFSFPVCVLLLVALSPVVVVGQDQSISLGRPSSSSSSPPGSPPLVVLDSDQRKSQFARQSPRLDVRSEEHRSLCFNSCYDRVSLSTDISDLQSLSLRRCNVAGNLKSWISSLSILNRRGRVGDTIARFLPVLQWSQIGILSPPSTVFHRHFSRSCPSFEAEQQLQHRVSPPKFLSATRFPTFISIKLTGNSSIRHLKSRNHCHILADFQLSSFFEMCYGTSSHVNLQSPALVETSASLPLAVYHRRRQLLETTVTLIMSVHSYSHIGGGGMFIQNPRRISMHLVGLYGPYTFLSCWVLRVFELNGLGLLDEYCQIKTVHYPRVSFTFLWSLFGPHLFIYLWALRLGLGSEHSLSVRVIIAKSRFVQSHLLQRAINFVFTLTSLSIIRSSVRESPMPLFKRAIFPGWIISNQRSYSQIEKFQTAYKRTLVEILKAALSWSPFEKCAIMCIKHLDPIEEIISMRFEELSLCFSLCIVMRFTFYSPSFGLKTLLRCIVTM